MPVDLGELTLRYERSEPTRKAVAHNVNILKCIRGGLLMAERHRIDFDPRAEYWRLPERRLVIAYLADRWTGRFAPPSAVRGMAIDLLRHFDRLRTDGAITYFGVDYEEAGGLAALCEQLAEHALRLPPPADWLRLRAVWPKLGASIGADVAEFLRSLPATPNWEHGFARRLPWLGYIRAETEETLKARQRFFFGFANLWTTSNAYVRAGAQAFAPVLQNTTTGVLLDKARTWAEGGTPAESGFVTLGRDDDDSEPQDRSEYAAVIETSGFLGLERAPFYNNRAETYREWFDISGNPPAFELMRQVGARTASWLRDHREQVHVLSELYRTLLEAPLKSRVELETVESPRVRKTALKDREQLLDIELLDELDGMAKKELSSVNEDQGARIALHLLLDSHLFLETEGPTGGRPKPVSPPAVPTVPVSAVLQAPLEEEVWRLPPALRADGERALAYLRAGLHVLFAGAPGTGKTTLAQFVGYSWDRELAVLPDEISASDAPLTTVGNSAWSPFHTIGGLMPLGDGTFKSQGGIFIDPGSVAGTVWRLRSGALILDEMNRADLDRCIGELYPLLSASVRHVAPAGLPGVDRIEASARFRVIATVNDANLDDIVFPISEGLARRFQRIELQGGTKDELFVFLGIDGDEEPSEPRRAAAHEAVLLFFDTAREANLLVKTEDDDRLPFGVAYFTLLQKWLKGQLQTLSVDGTPKEQARDLLASSLRTLGRHARWEQVLRTFLSRA